MALAWVTARRHAHAFRRGARHCPLCVRSLVPVCPCVCASASRACSSAPNLRAWDVSSFWLKESLPRRELSAAPRARTCVCVRCVRGVRVFSRARARPRPHTTNLSAETPPPPPPCLSLPVAACELRLPARVCIKEVRKTNALARDSRVRSRRSRETRSAHCPATPQCALVHMVSVCRGGRHIFGSFPDPLGHPGPVHARLSLLADHNQRRFPAPLPPRPPPAVHATCRNQQRMMS